MSWDILRRRSIGHSCGYESPAESSGDGYYPRKASSRLCPVGNTLLLVTGTIFALSSGATSCHIWKISHFKFELNTNAWSLAAIRKLRHFVLFCVVSFRDWVNLGAKSIYINPNGYIMHSPETAPLRLFWGEDHRAKSKHKDNWFKLMHIIKTAIIMWYQLLDMSS